VVADESESGHAIIASGRNEERAYRIGQSIDGGSGATLHSVFADRVILSRGGVLETLRLPDLTNGAGTARISSSLPPPPPPPSAVPDPAMDAPASGSLREVISDNAANLANIIRVSPHVEGGQMVGFRVNPGRERDMFASLGLEPGDVVTDINGMALDDPARGLQIFESLGEATMANVTLMRNGVVQTLMIDTSQLDSLAEGRQ
jgi:general secretion pathway protein C